MLRANDVCTGDRAQFKGIGYRYLHELYKGDRTHTEIYDVLRASAESTWNLGRNSAGLFAPDWAGPPVDAAGIESQSSAVMAVQLFADLVGTYPGSVPAATYEAEEGVLHGIGVEATRAGFSGWGYLAGWHEDGQRVDFPINVAADGAYNVELIYATGAGNATRSIGANGSDVVTNQAFPSTGAWSTYASAVVHCNLHRGMNSLSISFNAANGSSNWLNLDHINISK